MDTKKYVSLPGKFSIGFGIFGWYAPHRVDKKGYRTQREALYA